MACSSYVVIGEFYQELEKILRQLWACGYEQFTKSFQVREA